MCLTSISENRSIVSCKCARYDVNSRKSMFYNFATRSAPRAESFAKSGKLSAPLVASRTTIEREKQNEDVEPRESLRRDPEHAGRINPRWMIIHGGTWQRGASTWSWSLGPLGTGFRNDPRLRPTQHNTTTIPSCRALTMTRAWALLARRKRSSLAPVPTESGTRLARYNFTNKRRQINPA